jgi:hypothetical protein
MDFPPASVEYDLLCPSVGNHVDPINGLSTVIGNKLTGKFQSGVSISLSLDRQGSAAHAGDRIDQCDGIPVRALPFQAPTMVPIHSEQSLKASSGHSNRRLSASLNGTPRVCLSYCRMRIGCGSINARAHHPKTR